MALEPGVLAEHTLASKPQPLQDPCGGRVLDVTDGADTVESELSEEVAEETPDRLRGVSVSLVATGQGESDFSLSRFIR
jgi:hypothetical protein